MGVAELEDECLSQHLRIQELELQVREYGGQDLVSVGFFAIYSRIGMNHCVIPPPLTNAVMDARVEILP